MSRQILITGIACLIAAGVLVVTIMLSPALPDPDDPIDPKLPDSKGFAPHDPKALTDQNSTKQAGVVRKYFVRHWNEKKKQLTIFAGESITPKPNGVADVVGPSAQIHLVPGKRVILIQGKEGTIVAPNNNVESGEIRKGVVVSFFATDEDRNVDLSANSNDVTGRIFLDEAVRFDLELGTLESNGPVYGTSAMGEYKGRGLNLILSERQRRINQFIIHHGEEIRFKVTEKNKNRLLQPSGTDTAKEPTTETKSPSDRVPTYYKIAFADNVRVTIPDAHVNAAKLSILAADASTGQSKGLLGSFSSPANAGGKKHDDVPDLPVGDRSSRSLFTPEDSDWIVRWSGPMRVDPIDEKPEILLSPNDRVVEMESAHIKTSDGEEIIAAKLDYRTSDARVRLYGRDGEPLVVASDKLGRMEGQQFVILQNEGKGTFVGPGSITTHGSLKAAAIEADGKPLPVDATKVPSDMSIRWSKGVDIVFFMRDNKQPASGAPNVADGSPLLATRRLGKLDALKSATFNGDVDVKHEQFDLAANTLGITMSEPDAKTRRSEPHRILAKGDVKATARGSKKQPPIEIKAGEFAVTFKPDATGKARPARFIALNDVRTSQPDRRMRAETLDVELVSQPRTGADGKQDDVTIAMRSVRADKNVFIELDNPRTRVTAERLIADVEAGTLDLFGTDDLPATIMREDNLLNGKHILMREKDRFVKVNGAGSAVMLANADAIEALNTAGQNSKNANIRLASADNNIAALPAAVDAKVAGANEQKNSKEPQRVKISWLDGMEFNDTLGQAQFMGQVVATSDRKTDVTRFQAGELHIDLTPAPPGSGKGIAELLSNKDADGDADNANKADDAGKKDDASNDQPAIKKSRQRVIQRMVARHQVVFEAEKWVDRVGGNLDTRFRLRGPVLTFDQKTEVIDVDGAGSMQIEDYRKKKSTATETKADDPTVAFVGQGVTLFIWKGGMTLDAKKNDMAMRDSVQMIQLEKGSQQPVQMDCELLNANFASTGGLATWLSGKPPEPDLETVVADGGVRIIHQDKTIRGHRMEYKGSKRMVELTEKDGRFCTLDDEKTSLPAKSFKWYLDKDKIVAIEPGAVRARVNDE